MRTNFRMEDEYITMVRGDTLSFGIEIEDQDGNALDADAVFFSCKQTFASELSVFRKTLGDGISKLETGKYIMRISPEDTRNIESGKYVYDLRIGLNGDVFTFKKGVLEIEQEVTTL